ncbi:MAG: antibiotic biosynthesis monooxygenase family protein [Leptolyngbyaceae cyanobacterium]
MSDFYDFLKRTLASVAIGEFKSGKFCEAQELYEQAIATYGKGFRGAYLLQEPGTDRGISVIFWDSVEEMDENERKLLHQDILKKMNPLFVKAPTVSIYEVVSDLKPQDLAAAQTHSL